MKQSKFKFCHSLAAWYQQLLPKFRSLHLWKENDISSVDNWETWNGCTVSDRNRWPIGHYHVVMEATCLLMLLTVHLKISLTILILDASKLEFDLHLYSNLWNLEPGEGNGDPLHILAWKVLWIEKPGGLQSMGSQSQTQPRDWAWAGYTEVYGHSIVDHV